MADQAAPAIVLEALNRSEILVLSTVDSEAGTWTCPVLYQWDRQLGLYFSSLADARHVTNIALDDRVSVAIYSFPGPPGGNLGLQITGAAHRLTVQSSQEGWLHFKITPRKLWYFDSRVDRERREVDLMTLDLGRDDGKTR